MVSRLFIYYNYALLVTLEPRSYENTPTRTIKVTFRVTSG